VGGVHVLVPKGISKMLPSIMVHKDTGTVLGIVLEATGSGHGWAIWGQSCPSIAGDFPPEASGW
jgi:hypothetical protein